MTNCELFKFFVLVDSLKLLLSNAMAHRIEVDVTDSHGGNMGSRQIGPRQIGPLADLAANWAPHFLVRWQIGPLEIRPGKFCPSDWALPNYQ